MAVINVTAGSQAILTLGSNAALAVPGATDSLSIPFLQDLTISATPGTVRYSTLDSSSSSAFTTVNENSVSCNMLVDDVVMFGDSGHAVNGVKTNGLFETSKAKTEIFFSVSFEGTGTTGDTYWTGKGFIGGLAPNASIDQAVWISPMEIIVNGELTKTDES